MGLFSLPAELLHRICAFCTAPDGLTLRLVCRLLRDVTDEHFMKGVSLHFLRNDFDMAEELTLNPRIAKSVKEVYFQADRLAPLCFHEWNAQRKSDILEERGEFACGGDCGSRACRLEVRNYHRETNRQINAHSKMALRAAFAKYEELVLDEATMIDESRQQMCFQTLFERCPKLDLVAIGMEDELYQLPWESAKDFREAMVGPYGDEVSSRIGYRPLRELLLAMYETGKSLKRLDIAPISHQFFKPCSCCTHRYHDAISRVQDLYISINERDLYQDKPGYDESSAVDAWLAIQENPTQSYHRVVRSFEHGGLAAFVGSASRLTALSLVAPDPIPQCAEDALALRNIVRDNHWPHLTTLLLHNFKCSDMELVKLLERHADTLENMSLCNVTFVEGSAQSCFEAIAGRLPQLKRLALRGRFKAHGFRSVSEADLILSNASHWVRPDLYTRTLQKYLIKGGRFPSPALSGYVYYTSYVDSERTDEEDDQHESDADVSDGDEPDETYLDHPYGFQ